MARRDLFWAILLAGLAVRLVRIGIPMLEVAPTRQAQTAVIARNLWRGEGDLFHPKVDDLPEPGYLVLECPLYNAAVALLYRLTGGVHEWLGRLVSALCAVGAAGFLFSLVRRLHGEAEALLAAAVLLFLPVSILYTRTFQPEGLMLLCGIGAVWAAARWVRAPRGRDLVLTAVLLALTGLVKLQMLLVLGPVVFLVFAHGRMRDLRFWSALALSLGIIAAWFAHAAAVNAAHPSPYSHNYGAAKWFSVALLADPSFWLAVLERAGGVGFTPLGLALVVMGSFLPVAQGNERLAAERLAHLWLACACAALLAFNRNAMTHDYYYLLLAPPGAILIAQALCAFARQGAFRTALSRALLTIVAAVLVARYAAGAYRVPEHSRHLLEAAAAVRGCTATGDRVIAAGGGGPAFLYYCDRKGRGISIPRPEEIAAQVERLRSRGAVDPVVDPILILEEERAAGAKLLAIAVLRDLERNPSFAAYCRTHLRLIEEKKGAYILYAIPPRGEAGR